MKTCRTCGEVKALEHFAKDNRASGVRTARGGGGVTSSCKGCTAERRSPGITARKEAEAREVFNLASQGLKRCTKCREVKLIREYNIRKASPDGLMQKCKSCCKAYADAWRESNPDNFKDYYAGNKSELNQKFKEWREANPERNAERLRLWGQENAALISEKGTRRRFKKAKASPKWADRKKMLEFYREAERLTAETGVVHHVDHIYPLQSDEVCGLHCEFNLNVITQFENIQKLNRMPTEEYLKRCER